MSHMRYLKGLGKTRSRRDMATGMENLNRKDNIDLSHNSNWISFNFIVEMNSPIADNFPEKEKLQEAFTNDPLENSVYSKSNHGSSWEKLPSLPSYSQSRADSAMGSYLEKKIFGRKKYSSVSSTNLGPKQIKLDPSRVIVFKKGRALNQGYFIIEFSYTKSYFWITAYNLETNEQFMKKMNSSETEACFKHFNNSYDAIANSISIKGNYISIQKYKGKDYYSQGYLAFDDQNSSEWGSFQGANFNNNQSLSVILEAVG